MNPIRKQRRQLPWTEVASFIKRARSPRPVGMTNYTWDNNGNLTNDGSTLYRYDQANRMISTTLATTTTLFNYNGDGVRLKQVSAGVPTTYTQDFAAPLPVVLQAKAGAVATQYLFSMGTRPIAQYTSSAWQYLLADGLGSMRQIADASGHVILAESYQPYGALLNSSGSGSSIFAYAGEQIDTGGLIYLRARYMQPGLGIFLSHDPYSGDVMRPGSMNGFGYAGGNPIIRIDPSGLWECYPKNDGCAQWIFSALDLLKTGGAMSNAFLNLFNTDNDVKYWFVLDAPDTGFTVPGFSDPDHVLISRAYLSDRILPPIEHVGLFVHETVHTFRNPAERSTIFGEVEAYTVQADVLEEFGSIPADFMTQLRDVAVEGGQVTRDLDKLAKARCILINAFKGQGFIETVYTDEALIFNYNFGLWETTCQSCATR